MAVKYEIRQTVFSYLFYLYDLLYESAYKKCLREE